MLKLRHVNHTRVQADAHTHGVEEQVSECTHAHVCVPEDPPLHSPCSLARRERERDTRVGEVKEEGGVT